jgi:hypothetical protein
MRHLLKYYLLAVALAVAIWVFDNGETFTVRAMSASWFYFLGVFGLYVLSHLFRMMRLALLTLDQRQKIFPLISAHALTAFPSSFLPFKIGEILRLGSFFYVYGGDKKALAVWLAERFGDILVISFFILALYFFRIDVPDTLRLIFFVFIFFSVLGLLAFFAVAKVSVFLNRYLVLSSHSPRGLKILKFSHRLRRLEESIYRSIEGRFIGLLLFSIVIWGCEILALFAFIASRLPSAESYSPTHLMDYFAAGLSGSLNDDVLYQSAAMVLLTVVFISVIAVSGLLRRIRRQPRGG